MAIDRFGTQRFEKAISEIRNDWSRSIFHNKYIYSFKFGDAVIFIDSTINVSTGISADTGADSIRIFFEIDGRYGKKHGRRWVTRMPGWEQRLKDTYIDVTKIINDLMFAKDLKCPRCGAEMKLRKGVHGKFYGCTRFPNCRGTIDYMERKDVPVHV